MAGTMGDNGLSAISALERQLSKQIGVLSKNVNGMLQHQVQKQLSSVTNSVKGFQKAMNGTATKKARLDISIMADASRTVMQMMAVKKIMDQLEKGPPSFEQKVQGYFKKIDTKIDHTFDYLHDLRQFFTVPIVSKVVMNLADVISQTKLFNKISSSSFVQKMKFKFPSLREELKFVSQGIGPRVMYINSSVKNSLQKIKPLIPILKWLTVKPFKLTLKVTDFVTRSIWKVTKSLANLAKGIQVPIKTVLSKGFDIGVAAFKDGMELEKQKLSMDHLVQQNNPLMSSVDAQKASDSYYQSLRSNAGASPFESSDIMTAGMQAINVSGGNTDMAMQLVKLAQDMASVAPGKSVADAMEALANAKDGKMDGLQEFGVNATRSNLDAAGGNLLNMQSGSGKSMLGTFGGNTEKYATTTSAGMIAKMSNGVKSGLSDVGLKMAQAAVPLLQQLMPYVEKLQPLFVSLGDAMAAGIGKVAQFFSENKGQIDGFAKSAQTLFASVMDGAGEFFQWLMPLLPKMLDYIVGNIKMAIKFLEPLLPPIINIFRKVIEWVVDNMPVFQAAIGAVFDALAPVIQRVIDVFQFLWGIWKEAWPMIQDIIATAWGIVEPIIGAIANIIEIVIAVAQRLWIIAKPIFKGIWEFLEPIVAGIGKAVELFGEGLEWIKNKIVGTDNSNSPTPGNVHAAGLHTVPRDNYPALLHKNEAVLTAAEANQYRNGRAGVGNSVVINVNHPVVRDESDFNRMMLLFRRELEAAGLNMA